MNRLLKLSIKPEDFMKEIATGVLLCDLALAVSPTCQSTLGKINTAAKPSSFPAHENATVHAQSGWSRVCFQRRYGLCFLCHVGINNSVLCVCVCACVYGLGMG